MVPYLEQIIPVLVQAFHRYQTKNTRILYDAISVLAEGVDDQLNRPAIVEALMTPLMDRFRTLDDDDEDLWPLFECLGPLCQALKVGFLPFAPEIFARCLSIITQYYQWLQQANEAAAAGHDVDLPDRGYLVSSLDLLSSLAEGLGSSVESLVSQSNILAMVAECAQHNYPDVRQSAFALLGDLSKFSIGWVRPHLGHFLPLIAANLDPRHHAVCTNASWALGEIAVKVGADVKPYLSATMEKIVQIYQQAQALNLQRPLLENIAITVGRLALSCADVIGPMLPLFAPAWCYFLGLLSDDVEKTHAFHGMCLAVHTNPRGILEAFPLLCDAIASWEEVPAQLGELFASLLRGFKGSLGAEWENYFGGQCQPATCAKLIQLYGV
jgi:transportin-1